MNRSNYSDDLDQSELAMWRGQVASALRGKRGQAFLRELVAALDALPEPRLIPDELVADGAYCALGAVGRLRGLANMDELDPYDYESLAGVFGIAHQMVQEIEFLNDDRHASPEDRWRYVREWAIEHIVERETP